MASRTRTSLWTTFARHLTEFFKKDCGFEPTITPEKIEHDDWVEVCLHLTTLDRGPKHGKGEIDLYEYYWAPCTEGKITYREVLRWLAITTLTPIRYLALNLEVESDSSYFRRRGSCDLSTYSVDEGPKPVI